MLSNARIQQEKSNLPFDVDAAECSSSRVLEVLAGFAGQETHIAVLALDEMLGATLA